MLTKMQVFSCREPLIALIERSNDHLICPFEGFIELTDQQKQSKHLLTILASSSGPVADIMKEESPMFTGSDR